MKLHSKHSSAPEQGKAANANHIGPAGAHTGQIAPVSTLQNASLQQHVKSAHPPQYGPVQLKKTSIKHSSKVIDWHGAKGEVGTAVDASLNPDEPVLGSAVDSGHASYTAIDTLVSNYNSGQWARGHLLNHDLGGEGVPKNLFPITAGANKRHANYVEYRVKDALAVAKKENTSDPKTNDWVHYKVDVNGTPSKAQFMCEWKYMDKADKEKDVSARTPPAGKFIIPSELKGPGKGKQPLADPYHNSMEATNMHHPVWHHGDRKGAQAPQKQVSNQAGALGALAPIDASTKKSSGGHILADGEMTDEQKEAMAEAMAHRRAQSMIALFDEKALRTIRSEVGTAVFHAYADPTWPQPAPKLADLKEKYAPLATTEVDRLKPWAEAVLENDEAAQKILQEDHDPRSSLIKLIRGKEEFQDAIAKLQALAMKTEREQNEKKKADALAAASHADADADMTPATDEDRKGVKRTRPTGGPSHPGETSEKPSKIPGK